MRRGGTIQVTIDGVRVDAKGNYSYNLGRPVRESIIGADGVHGYIERPQPAFIEGEITDRVDLDLAALVSATNISVHLELAIGKSIALRNAWFAGEGTGNSEEGNIAVRFEGQSGEEIS
jgi:hypothetical protein